MPVKVTRLSFRIEERKQDRKTDLWRVWSLQGGTYLGEVSWWAHWRKYTFRPIADSVFDGDCLREIATFCELETQNHRSGRRTFADQES